MKYDLSKLQKPRKLAFDALRAEDAEQQRASNGQFGAGVGKSHSEHVMHHDAKAHQHLKAALAAPSKNGTRNESSKKHFDAAYAHQAATRAHAHAVLDSTNPKASAAAHALSEEAHGATKAASQ